VKQFKKKPALDQTITIRISEKQKELLKGINVGELVRYLLEQYLKTK
jgi:hypothetical protein